MTLLKGLLTPKEVEGTSGVPMFCKLFLCSYRYIWYIYNMLHNVSCKHMLIIARTLLVTKGVATSLRE